MEFFADYETLSAQQADELNAGPGDLLIGVTATAETTSIQATAYRASVRGATAFEAALCTIAGKAFDKAYYVEAFQKTVAYIQCDACIHKMAGYAQEEAALYGGIGYVTCFTENYMLDILTDSTERRADELIKVYRAGWREPIGVFRNGQFWGSFAYGEGGIKYLALRGYEEFAEMVYEFMLAKGPTAIPYDAPDYDKTLMKNCIKNCSSFAIGNPANFKILHFEKAVKAFLQLKADNEPLCDGEITLSSELFGKYRIAVKDSKVSVEKFEGEAKYHLAGYEICDFLFNFTPNSYSEYDPAVKSWFPMPINAPYLA